MHEDTLPSALPPQSRPVERTVELRVHYPLRRGRMVLRGEHDWDTDLEPMAQGEDRTWFDFRLRTDLPVVAFKPCIRDGDAITWSAGTNKLATPSSTERQNVYPHFQEPAQGRITDVIELAGSRPGHPLQLRVYLPPGYDDNTLKRYPVLYMHDGKNLFFPEEAFCGREWRVDETLDVLSRMNLIDQTIVVGVHAGDRMHEYTAPGYVAHGETLCERLKPFVDAGYRTLTSPRRTAVMGSSLGGVVSLFLAWQWPDVFGNAACLSSTFSFRDDLFQRVHSEPIEPRAHLKFYLDSGWPKDNYEVTLSMATALLDRGFVFGRDLLHFAFPNERHDEHAWAARLHLPLQLFAGKLRGAAERARERQERMAPAEASRRAPAG